MMNPPSRTSVLATLLMGLYLIPPVHIQAQIVADVPSVASFTELQQVLDAAWMDRTTSALYPPGLTYTNSLPLIAVEAGFDQAFLAALQAGATPGGIALRKGIVREDLAGRLWFGSSATPVATTTFPVGYDPVQWVLDTFPPPPGTTGNDLDDYIADRRLTRQAMAFSLIAAADVPAYEAELHARFAAAAAAAANLGEEDIGMIHVELTPPSGPMEILVRAPFWVDYLGVYETRDLMNPFPWTPLGTVPHTFDPMAWSYPLPGDLRYVILANHMVDSDGDGIIDAIERLVLGTDPENWDSDGDGVGDYAEVYIFESNPLLGGVGGVADQIILGLGIKTPDMTKVVSGPVELRHKTWRAERSKAGFAGLMLPNTFFARMTGRVEMAGVYKATMSGLYDIEKQDNRAQTSETDPIRHPFKKTWVDLPAYLAGTNDGWGIKHGVSLHYPQPGDGIAANNNHVLINTPVPVTLPVPMTYTAIDEVILSEEYTDSTLRWKTLLDVLSVRMMDAPLDWGGGRRLIRPMPWVTDSGTGQSSFDPNPQDVSAGSRAERHADTVGAPPVLTGLKLQQMAFQATSSEQSFPVGHFLRTVLLEVHRSQPENPAEEGAVTKVVPKPVYLKHGTPSWESMVFEMPPPVENGTVEMEDGYVDLRLQYVSEKDEENVGDKICAGITVPFSVERGGPWSSNAVYRMYLDRPAGSQAVVRHLSAEVPSGSQIAFNLPHCSITPDLPGVYSLRVEVASSIPGDSGAAPLLVDRVVIHGVEPPSLCADYNRDGRIDALDAQIRDTPFGPNQQARRWVIWSNDDDDAGDDALNSERTNASLDDLPYSLAAAGNTLQRQPGRTMDLSKVGKPWGSRFPGPPVRDWVDYFALQATFPRAEFSDQRYEYRISTDIPDGIRFAVSSLQGDDVGLMQASTDPHFYESDLAMSPPYPLQYAAVDGPATRNGRLIPEWLDDGHGILYLCGAQQGTGELVVEITDTLLESPRVVGRAAIPFQVAAVTNMFRYINVRLSSELYRVGVAQAVERTNPELQKPAATGPLPTRVGTPSALPDGYYRANQMAPPRTIVVTHGVDWDEDETPAGLIEVFKRLHQSGSNARFVGVSWPSNMGRESIAGRAGPFDYYEDVIAAFVSAKYAAAALHDNGFDGNDTVLLAHSLGNILSCSMIQDHGLNVGTYMLLNAAVPVEALLPAGDGAGTLGMVPEEWKNDERTEWRYPSSTAASNWFRLFPATDPRSALRWQGRFSDVAARTRCVNYYSSGEEVLNSKLSILQGDMPELLDLWGWLPMIPSNPNTLANREFVWVRQEMHKGNIPPVLDYGGILGGWQDDHGGWGNPGGGRSAAQMATAAIIPSDELIATPFFRGFQNTDPAPTGFWATENAWLYQPAGSNLENHLSMPPFDAATTDRAIYRHAKLLAEAIPALSTPAGGSPITRTDTYHVQNIDLDKDSIIRPQEPNGNPIIWPTAEDGGREGKPYRWLHGDYKDAAYVYVKGLYDNIVEQGALQ